MTRTATLNATRTKIEEAIALLDTMPPPVTIFEADARDKLVAAIDNLRAAQK